MIYRMYGDIVQLIHYIIHADRDIWCATAEEKDAHCARLEAEGASFSVEDIDQPEYEWLDGLEFPDARLVEVAAEMGQAAWNSSQYVVDTDKTLAGLILEVAKLKVGA